MCSYFYSSFYDLKRNEEPLGMNVDVYYNVNTGLNCVMKGIHSLFHKP